LRLPRRGTAPVIGASVVLVTTLATFLADRVTPLGFALALAICGATAASGRWPIPAGAALGLLLSLGVAWPELQSFASFSGLIPIALWGAMGLGRSRLVLSLWFLVAYAGGILANARAFEVPGRLAEASPSLVFVLFLFLSAWLLGNAIHEERRRSFTAHQDTVQQLRRDVARNLHDTVAYTLSTIAIRADQARLRGSGTVEDLSFIADNSRQAIADLRSIVSVLRRDSTYTDEQSTWTVESVSEVIDRKTAELTESGFTVTQSIDGDPAALPRSVQDTLGKVLHEALSNVHRHAAPRSNCALMLSVNSAEVELAVLNDMPPSTATQINSPLGIVGMRERVESIGGTLDAGPSGRRWALRATILLNR